MANEIWQEEDQKFLVAIRDIKIPNGNLDDVAFIVVKEISDFEKIPTGGGCYWIWTNEPVYHTLHKNPTPKPFEGGEIIYNGIAKDDVIGRIKHHLLGAIDAGWSGISLDIYFGDTISHRKKALSEKGKVPYILEKAIVKRAIPTKKLKRGDEIERLKPIRTKEDFLHIYLSEKEREQILQESIDKIHFRNGINIFDEKHKVFEFRVYFITGISPLYLDFIEKKWRKDFNLPKLCSYSSGR